MSGPLQLADPNSTVASANRDGAAAAVNGAADLRARARTRLRQRQLDIDMAIAGSGVELRSHARGEAENDVAVAAFEAPRRLHGGVWLGVHLDIAVSGGQGQNIQAAVEPDPPIELIERAGKIYTDSGCDGIMGLGGGSPMDTTKAVALRVSHSGEMREYESIVGGSAKIKPVLPPIICIPTTSGTGSEVNPYAVITDKERDLKFMLMSNYFIPRLAVIDPLYCKTMPAGLTVESGIDALTHCIEGYVSLAIPYHPYFEAMGVYGVKLIGRSLEKAYRDGNNISARTDMCMAAVCGGLAFLKGLGLGHAITHVLGAHYHLPHGRAATYGLLCFVKANKETCKEQFSDMAHLLNRSTDLESGLRDFYKKLDIRISLKAHSITKEDLKKIAFFTTRDAVNMATDPTSPSERQILELLDEIYD